MERTNVNSKSEEIYNYLYGNCRPIFRSSSIVEGVNFIFKLIGYSNPITTEFKYYNDSRLTYSIIELEDRFGIKFNCITYATTHKSNFEKFLKESMNDHIRFTIIRMYDVSTLVVENVALMYTHPNQNIRGGLSAFEEDPEQCPYRLLTINSLAVKGDIFNKNYLKSYTVYVDELPERLNPIEVYFLYCDSITAGDKILIDITKNILNVPPFRNSIIQSEGKTGLFIPPITNNPTYISSALSNALYDGDIYDTTYDDEEYEDEEEEWDEDLY